MSQGYMAGDVFRRGREHLCVWSQRTNLTDSSSRPRVIYRLLGSSHAGAVNGVMVEAQIIADGSLGMKELFHRRKGSLGRPLL